MALTPGSSVGPYEIVSALGAGGMGEVYRARDPRLRREVAIKILPAAFSADPDRLHRFEQEAHAAAALNHPNILAVYDIGAHQAAPFIVSELLEGETLRERLQTGPVAMRKAIAWAIQVTRGLAAAHEKGITHRDLKPENVFVTSDDRIKILDFGLAKLTQDQPLFAAATVLPTTPAPTEPGVVLGTAGYMAPEQVRGLTVDHRADVFAFGAMLYELLSGQRAFRRDTPPETMTAILNDEPSDLLSSERPIPPGLVRIVQRCLEKNPSARFQTASDLAFALEALSDSSADSNAIRPSASKPRERLAWMSALALATAIAVGATVWAFRPEAAAPEMRLDITAPPTTDPSSLALSPNGTQIVFVGAAQGRRQLWLRRLDSVSARPLPGTDGASQPFWSPDNRSLGFFADRRLKRIDIDGGSVQALAEVAFFGGGSWNHDDVIVFSPNAPLPLYRVPAAGGEAVPITRLDKGHTGHTAPHFLPDGRHFLYYVRGGPDVRGVYVGQLDSSESRRLLVADSGAVYAPSRDLLFLRQGTLFAQTFDPERLELTGTATPLAEQVSMGTLASPALSASTGGLIAYRTGPSDGQRQFLWFDRSGKEVGKAGDPGGALMGPSASPDGRHLALFQGLNGFVDIRLLDIERGVLTRFTSDPADDVWPVWSRDGKNIVFSSNRKGQLDLYLKAIGETGSEQSLLATPDHKVANDWSPDGRFLLYTSIDAKVDVSLWVLPLDGERKPFKAVQTDFNAGWAQFSPDGKWIAYASNESERWEIYVQRFPGPGPRSIVSTGGGVMARWRPDGKELFYIALDDRLTAVPIRFASGGQTIEAGTPTPLFATRVGGALAQTDVNPPYVVAPDGQRFLMSTVVDDANTSPITVILNWKAKH